MKDHPMRCPCTPFTSFLALCVAIAIATHCNAEELRVPAFTAYMLPNPESARFSEQKGIARWSDPAQSVNWYGKFAKLGELKLNVELCIPEGAQSRFKLTVGEEAHEATVTGLGLDKTVTVDFGVFKIATVGHHRMQLESMSESKGPIGDIRALLLDGPAT